MSRTDIFKCCFCGGLFKGFGNNPYPANKTNGAKCCDDCNAIYVIPARLKEMFENNKENKKN